jgi:glycosyltransferase involved in cell wall biosynthesis
MISVIIPAYNASDTIVECLGAFELQDYKDFDFDFEVIIVDDGSTDDSGKKALDFFAKSNIKGRAITRKNQGPATARNYGAREAKGEILL